MQRYVQQLIEDIHKARTIVKPPSAVWDNADTENECDMEDMVYVEQFIYGAKEPMHEITGIETELLPPPNKLNKEEKEKLTIELEALLEHHNFVPDFPIKFPLADRYQFLLEIWDDLFVEVSFGIIHIEFCTYDEEFCPFPGYCNTCKEIAAQMEADEKGSEQSDDNEIIMPF